MFEGLASNTPAIADLHLSNMYQNTSASLHMLALNFSARAETIFRMVSRLGLSSLKDALYKLSLESHESLAILDIQLGTDGKR